MSRHLAAVLVRSPFAYHPSEGMAEILVLVRQDGAEVELETAIDDPAVDGRYPGDAELTSKFVDISAIRRHIVQGAARQRLTG